METIVNDFTINIATANGTGSQSANLVIMKTMFDMGVPVSGKNLFPSNISGLPTWFIIRVSDAGYQAPGDRTHIKILMNSDTWEKDIDSCEENTVIIYNTDVKLPVERGDCVVIGLPMTTMARKINPKLARMIANMYYVGALVHLLQIDMKSVQTLLEKQFKGKASAIELNMQAIDEGRMFTEENFGNPQPFRLSLIHI